MRIVEEVLLDFLRELVELADSRFSDADLEKYSKQFPNEFAKWKAAEGAMKEEEKALSEAKKAANKWYIFLTERNYIPGDSREKEWREAYYDALRHLKQLLFNSKMTKLSNDYKNAENEFYQAISKAQAFERAKKAEQEQRARAEQYHYQRTFWKEYREVNKWKSYIRSQASLVSGAQRNIELYKGYIAKGYTRYERYLGYAEKRFKLVQEKLNGYKAKLAEAESDLNAKVAAEKPKYLAEVAKKEEEKKAKVEKLKFQRMFPTEFGAMKKWEHYKRAQEARMKAIESNIDKYKGYIAKGYKQYQKYVDIYTKTYNEATKKVNEYTAKLAIAEGAFNAKMVEAKAAEK